MHIWQGSKLAEVGGGGGGGAPLNPPAAPSIFCKEPKDVLLDIYNTLRLYEAYEYVIGLPEKYLNFEPCKGLQIGT